MRNNGSLEFRSPVPRAVGSARWTSAEAAWPRPLESNNRIEAHQPFLKLMRAQGGTSNPPGLTGERVRRRRRASVDGFSHRVLRRVGDSRTEPGGPIGRSPYFNAIYTTKRKAVSTRETWLLLCQATGLNTRKSQHAKCETQRLYILHLVLRGIAMDIALWFLLIPQPG